MITILLVEDHLELRLELARVFGRAGWKTHTAASLCEARMLLGRTGLDVAIHPDVVLSDRVLPDGDGAEIIRPGGPPAILFTGDDRPVPGALAVIGKGGTLQELVARVTALMDPEWEGRVATW